MFPLGKLLLGIIPRRKYSGGFWTGGNQVTIVKLCSILNTTLKIALYSIFAHETDLIFVAFLQCLRCLLTRSICLKKILTCCHHYWLEAMEWISNINGKSFCIKVMLWMELPNKTERDGAMHLLPMVREIARSNFDWVIEINKKQ